MKLKDLRLALSATPKRVDVRYYLNALKITNDHILGSTGNVLCHIHTYLNIIPDDHENIIVPVDTIKALLKKIGTKHGDQDVGILLINGCYELACMDHVEVFKPIFHKYPDVKKIIDTIKAADHGASLNAIKHQFDWQCVANANNAICAYMGNTVPKRLYSIDKTGYFMPTEDIIYIIMPCNI